MTNTRIATIAAGLDVHLDADALEASTGFLDRMASGLDRTWPDAVESHATARRPADPGSAVSEVVRDPDIPTAPALAADGGAYISIYPEPFPPPIDPGGPLQGWTLAVKDLIAVGGLPLGAGSRVRAHAPPEKADAPLLGSLRSAGARLVGTTALHEFAFGVTGVNHYTGTPINPAAPGRMPGGSSSGSAVAVAEGSARLAVGTDTGGSVRIPAALCGVVGFKPAFESYATDGVFPLSPSLDHVGLLAATVADIDAAHRAVVTTGPRSTQIAKIGIAVGDVEGSAPEVRDAVDRALARMRTAELELIEVALPDPEHVFAVSTAILFFEAAAVHRDALAVAPGAYGPDVRLRLIQGLAIPEDQYETAKKGQAELRRRVLRALDGVDCIVGPTVPVVAPPLSRAADPQVSADLVAFTRLANVSGLPAISLPIAGNEMSAGLQILGPADDVVLHAATAIEELLAG